MCIVDRIRVLDFDNKEYEIYEGFYKGFSFAVKFFPEQREPVCYLYCDKDYNVNREVLLKFMRQFLNITPIVSSWWSGEIIFSYVVSSSFCSCTNLMEIKLPRVQSGNKLFVQEHLDITLDYCRHIVDYLDFLDHPERMYT